MEFSELAARIRETREACGFTAQELAADLSVPESVYLAYEENGLDIPISVLYHLSQTFKVDLNELLTGKASHLDTLSIVRRGRGLPVDRYPGYSFENLAHTFRHKMMEPMLVTIEPSDKEPAMVKHGGQEFNMVLEGTILLLYDGKRVELQPGDCVYFDPSRPHGQCAVGQKSRFLTIIAE